MTEDTELLRRHVREGSETAFAELVQRQTGLVYSAALRQTNGDMLLAQDVSQSVFIDLARKAPRLLERPVLASWLHTSTRFAARKAVRSKLRRERREQVAQSTQELEGEGARDAEWARVRPLLDAALGDLPEADRVAVLLRYFEDQPYAAMGARLGIGESSARMRTERALDKLHLLLLKRGATSTAVALGLCLAAQAVAAPPIGLGITLANGALAAPAAVGTGAGLLLKFSKLFATNKVPTSALAFAGVAAGVAATAPDPSAGSSAFFVYSVCFGVGLLFTLVSAVFGHSFGGHGDVGGHDAGGHGHGHAGGGDHPGDMPSISPLSPTTIATFLTAFGGFGMIFTQLEATHSIWISAPLATVCGLGVAVPVFLLFRTIFKKTQASSEGRVADLAGLEATVITPIAADGVGEIAYVQLGTRYSAPARAEDGATFANGATVKITRVIGTQFYVASPWASHLARTPVFHSHPSPPSPT